MSKRFWLGVGTLIGLAVILVIEGLSQVNFEGPRFGGDSENPSDGLETGC